MFEKQVAEALLLMVDNEAIGFALYFYNFSTFVGRAGLYLEDLFIRKEYRGRGYGKHTFIQLAGIAREKGCGRMEWTCLNWNKPSIEFYLSLGAEPMDEWTVYRLDSEKILNLSNNR